jgi:sugar phosphate isomerase/epimerase
MMPLRTLYCAVALGWALTAAATVAKASEAASLPDHPIGRCVRVLGVNAPEEAKKVGFDYLELALQDLLPLSDEEFAKTVARLKAVGLPAISGYGFLPADLQIVGPAADAKRIEAEVRRGLDRAQQLGLHMVVYGNLLTKGRSVPDGFSRAEASKQLAAFSGMAAREARARGVTVLFEPMPARSTNLVNALAEGVALVSAVDSPHFQLLVDYGYFLEGKEDLTVVTRAAPFIRQIEIQNPNGRVYPRRVDEADYAAFFRALMAGGYRGGFSIHGKPEDVFVDAPRAIALLRGLVADAAKPTVAGAKP